jgi:hypothetical protein
MKFLFLLLFCIGVITPGIYCQNLNSDTLVSSAGKLANDKPALQRMLKYSNEIAFHNPSNALRLDQKTLYLARQMHYPKLEADALNSCAKITIS